ncbi:MAG: class I SAM-dependent methyltransferase [Candidatus Omnitrophica bacterium]|nr:class I SAM-dependent methyltransferase [Candidatus Omnitrophota bacterium]
MNPVTYLTKKLRANQALPFISRANVHVDIGCGRDKYLLKRSPCAVKIGYDQQLQTPIADKIPLESKTADYITMLAVIEHLEFSSKLIKECFRVLKDDGRLILTTPKAKGLWLMKLYDPGFAAREGDHCCHFDRQSMSFLLNDFFDIEHYKTFELGFNQLFVCKKREK